MKVGYFGSIVGIACVLTVAGAVAAWQPEGRPARREQPAGQPGERGPGRGPNGERGREQGPPPSVEGSMKGMNRAMRQLSAQIGDQAKQEENLRLINDMQRACVNAKAARLRPETLEKAADEEGKAKLASEYRLELIKALRLMLDVETDLAAGDTEAAAAKLGALRELKDHGHEEMGVD